MHAPSASMTGPATDGVPGVRPLPPRRWVRRRAAPITVSILFVLIGMGFSLWWNQHMDHAAVWYEPADLWRTMLAAVRLDHGQIGQLYANGTNLVSFPGAAVLLAPAAGLISLLHLPLGPPIGSFTDTNAWLIAGPYMMAVSCSVLFATDRLAETMGVGAGKRFVLAGAEAFALWNVAPYWGHPEDCVAVALTLFAVDAAVGGRTWRCAWLVGIGLAVQPLVLLAVPILAVIVGGRQIVGWLIRAAIPPAVAVGAALAANWSATWYQVVDQPNWPYIDRPTPWIALAPHLTAQTVSAGPGRSIAVVLAVLACWPAWRAWRRAGGISPSPPAPGGQDAPALAPGGYGRRWPVEAIATVVWWVAIALALRCAFEAVMVSYYLWPGIAVGVLASSRSWWRLIPTAVLGIGLTCFCNVWWHGEWPWWSVVVVTLALLLVAAKPDLPRRHSLGNRAAREGDAARNPVSTPAFD